MAKDRMYIEPRTVIISNPAINYGTKSGTRVYVGEVRSFERRVRFGKEMPIPWMKEYQISAESAEAATPLLAKLAARDGYALGGILNVRMKE